jgi:prohibitin 2
MSGIFKFVWPVLVIIIVIIFIIFVTNSYTEINSGEVGVITLFGKPSSDILSPGLNWVNPFSTVHHMDLKIITTSIKSEAASSDLQMVDTSITLNYKLDGTKVIDLLTKIGKNSDIINSNIVQPAMSESFKAVVAHFTAEDLVNKRDLVSQEIQKLLNEKLNKNYMSVNSISITDFQFSKTFNEAIENKVTAQQQVLTAQNNLLRQKVENEIKISKAQAEASALNLQKSAITDELLKLREIENTSKAIDKWNGVLPIYTGSNIPLVKITN